MDEFTLRRQEVAVNNLGTDWPGVEELEGIDFDVSLLPPASHRGHDGRDCWPRDLILEIVRRGGTR